MTSRVCRYCGTADVPWDGTIGCFVRDLPLGHEIVDLHDCGYIEDSFACRIRHINVNVENLRRGH